MSNLIELARSVEKAREALDRAITALRAATGLSASAPQRRSRQNVGAQPGIAPGLAPNVSQAVLQAIMASPTGVVRAELTPLGRPGAIQSALKQHKARGTIANMDGRWVVKTAAKTKGPRS